MMTFLNVFRSIGGKLDIKDGPDGGIRFWHPGDELRAVALETDVHPGFMTDWQQPMVVALTQARGLSIVHETVYERRLGYTEALNQMGATIQTYRECLGGTPCRFGRRNFRHSAVIAGPSKLHAADLVIPDLRAGFSHLIAALAAEGTSTVYGVSLINRGYEDFEAKLAALGAHVERSLTPRRSGPTLRRAYRCALRSSPRRSATLRVRAVAVPPQAADVAPTPSRSPSDRRPPAARTRARTRRASGSWARPRRSARQGGRRVEPPPANRREAMKRIAGRSSARRGPRRAPGMIAGKEEYLPAARQGPGARAGARHRRLPAQRRQLLPARSRSS